MLGAKEPAARPTEHNTHPNMVTIRNPNLLRKLLAMGPIEVATPIAIDDTHAATQMEKNSVSSQHVRVC